MTGLLASVSNLQEALLVESLEVDIIDLKQPAAGALGALPIEQVVEIVGALNGATVKSATIGDMPMNADLVLQAARAMSHTGVDYIKIGFFNGGDWQDCADALSALAQQGHALIAVLFADENPDFSFIDTLKNAGFRGVMLDTNNKQAGSLTRHLSIEQLSEFIARAKSNHLLTGLAGSLTTDDVPILLPLQADYLGFRGALCTNRQRTQTLEPARVESIRLMMQRL